MSPKREVYLDHSASTPVDSRVLETMMPYFSEVYGNPSSSHRWGRIAEKAIENARETVAGILNCKRKEIVFTGCGSESDNLAIRGAAWMAKKHGTASGLITTPIEHSAVIETVHQLADFMEFDAHIVPVDRQGFVDREAFRIACEHGMAVASVIYGNNEIGTVQNLAELSSIAHENKVLFHTDAVQAGGQLPLDVQALGVDMMSLSAHKFYGPKGVGVLYVRDGIELAPSQSGGSHESGRRAGTHNTAFIIGLAKALELAYAEYESRVKHYTDLRDRLIQGILSRVPDSELSGHPTQRLPSHSSFVFNQIDSNVLLMHLDMNGIAGSSGSACKTGNPEPSKVLVALGYSPEMAKSNLRLTVGMQTTAEDIDYTIDVVAGAVEKLSKLQREMTK